ncbi:AbgT family transporter [Actinoallomurus acanthiterrae]
MTQNVAAVPKRSTLLDRALGRIEWAGNKLPHPVLLFAFLFVLVAVLSSVLGGLGTTVTIPGTHQTKTVQGLLTADGVVWLLQNLVQNFAGFPPFATVIMLIMAVGLAERSGLLEVAVRATLARVPRAVLPYALAIVACQAHMMSDVANIVIPPLAAMAFKAAGRHPVAGLLGGVACVGAGYSAGFTVGSLDALLIGITQKSIAVLPGTSGIEVNLLVNYFFTAVSSIVLGLLGGFLISRVLEPRLGAYEEPDGQTEQAGISAEQWRGLRVTGIVLAAYVVTVLTAWLWPGSPLRGPGGALVPSPVLSGIVTLIFLAFLISGLTYGIASGTVRSAQDAVTMSTEAVKSMAGYVVLIFVAAQVIALFNWSNLGLVLAVKGAALLKSIGLTGLGVIVLFIALTAVLSLFIVSGSALWSLLAPVFVPAFMLLGMSPALSQAAFRVGDSAMHIVTPMNPYLLLALAMLREYEPEARFGTMISRLAIFALPFLVVWTLLLALFYTLGLPLGPGSGIHLH